MSMSHQKRLKIALYRQELIRPLALNPNVSKKDNQEACLMLDRKPRTIHRWVEEYRITPHFTTLLPGHRTNSKRKSRVPEKTQDIIKRRIKTDFLGKKEEMSAKALHQLIKRDCIAANTLAVSLRHVQRLVKSLRDADKARANKISKPVTAVVARHGHRDIEKPLQEVQIDHTQVDAILDLTEYGLGKKRPWVTLAIDVASRMVFGYYIGLKRPNSMTCGLALMQGILPKRKWVENQGISYEAFEKRGIGDPWPVLGIPEVVSSDRAKEFKSYAFTSGCEQLGIRPHLRPAQTPHFGGHIERLIGTFMNKVHMLTGTTFSNTTKRRNYKSEDKAFLTLDDLEKWFVLNILIYHLSKHEGLKGLTPLTKWRTLEKEHSFRRTLRPPDNCHVRAAFLPSVTRTVQQRGIEFQKNFYKNPALEGLIGKKVVVKYHRGKLNSFWVCLNGVTPSFEVTLIGKPMKAQHWDAPLDHTLTLAQSQETERQQDVADMLAAQTYDWAKQLARPRITMPRPKTKAPKRLSTVPATVPQRRYLHDPR